MKKTYIILMRRGDDCGRKVQWAYNRKHAEAILTIMPPLLPGYYYTIV